MSGRLDGPSEVDTMTERTARDTVPDAAGDPRPSTARRTGVVGRGVRSILPAAIILVVIVVAWELMDRAGMIGQFTLPPPIEFARALLLLPQEPFFHEAVVVTAQEAVIGFLIGSSLGLLLGVLVGTYSPVRRALQPLIVMFQMLPKPALAPLFVVWFGYGLGSKVMTAAAISFFPVFINTVAGLASIPEAMILLGRSYGASRRQVIQKIGFPNVLPDTFAGLKTSMSLAIVGAIIAEFVGAEKGMGALLMVFNFQLQLDLAFGVIFYLALLGYVLYSLIDLLDRRVVIWRGRS
jgi:NitT/TauT family transport system permease protein